MFFIFVGKRETPIETILQIETFTDRWLLKKRGDWEHEEQRCSFFPLPLQLIWIEMEENGNRESNSLFLLLFMFRLNWNTLKLRDKEDDEKKLKKDVDLLIDK